ncbi:MAG: DPP IV N-terminal domain-containing protein [Candidatus Aenigmarchaeota archaeon]|nr:DPP IV N-terminal domain-containing protein [Candidatus Aenigmarchaeota archaeon]
MRRETIILSLFILVILSSGCVTETPRNESSVPRIQEMGILEESIPERYDIIFSSVRHVLDKEECLQMNGKLKDNFLLDASCNRAIYQSGDLRARRQLYLMDMETSETKRILETQCFHLSGQVIDPLTIMTPAACSDTDNDLLINDKDFVHIYTYNVSSKTMECLTCEKGMEAINNPDWSPAQGKILFSARNGSFPNNNHLFTIDLEKNLARITNDPEYMDFDCSWSEDGTKIVFSRMPVPAFEKPSGIWIMDSDGTNLRQLTKGGNNPDNEENFGPFPVGIDVDPDISPDNGRIVFSRLITGKRNIPFGVWQLVVISLATGTETVYDSEYANMVPEWKENGILFIRQSSGAKPMDIKQSLYYFDPSSVEFRELETYPYSVFPVGAAGASWV